MTQNADMTPRELLESYGMLLDKSFCLARDTVICLKRAQETRVNESYWRNKAALLSVESVNLNSLIDLRQQQIDQMILNLSNKNERQVLELRYISLMGYRDISKAMRFSLRQIYRLHRRGIERLGSDCKAIGKQLRSNGGEMTPPPVADEGGLEAQ